jgi:Uri superfamily endonuclease
MSTHLKVRMNYLPASRAKGGYILILQLDTTKKINVGRLGAISLPEGFYAYLGSSLGGFKSRINRHLIEDKKPKWHIDYLTNEARIVQVIFHETEQRLECLLSQALVKELPFIPGFGSSDCHCRSHLYFASHRPSLELSVGKAIAQITTPEEHPKEPSRF